MTLRLKSDALPTELTGLLTVVGQSECSWLGYSPLLSKKPLQSQLENKLTATCRL